MPPWALADDALLRRGLERRGGLQASSPPTPHPPSPAPPKDRSCCPCTTPKPTPIPAQPASFQCTPTSDVGLFTPAGSKLQLQSAPLMLSQDPHLPNEDLLDRCEHGSHCGRFVQTPTGALCLLVSITESHCARMSRRPQTTQNKVHADCRRDRTTY